MQNLYNLPVVVEKMNEERIRTLSETQRNTARTINFHPYMLTAAKFRTPTKYSTRTKRKTQS